jgi:cytochrome c556
MRRHLILYHSNPGTVNATARSFRHLTLCFASFLVSITVGYSASADDQDVIDYRQHIMKTMGEQVEAVDQILQHKAPADNLAVHLKIIAITAATAKESFKSKVLGGESRPEIWDRFAEISKRFDELAAETAELADAAKTGGLTTATKFQSALSCKSCHDTFRREK